MTEQKPEKDEIVDTNVLPEKETFFAYYAEWDEWFRENKGEKEASSE